MNNVEGAMNSISQTRNIHTQAVQTHKKPQLNRHGGEKQVTFFYFGAHEIPYL